MLNNYVNKAGNILYAGNVILLSPFNNFSEFVSECLFLFFNWIISSKIWWQTHMFFAFIRNNEMRVSVSCVYEPYKNRNVSVCSRKGIIQTNSVALKCFLWNQGNSGVEKFTIIPWADTDLYILQSDSFKYFEKYFQHWWLFLYLPSTHLS